MSLLERLEKSEFHDDVSNHCLKRLLHADPSNVSILLSRNTIGAVDNVVYSPNENFNFAAYHRLYFEDLASTKHGRKYFPSLTMFPWIHEREKITLGPDGPVDAGVFGKW